MAETMAMRSQERLRTRGPAPTESTRRGLPEHSLAEGRELTHKPMVGCNVEPSRESHQAISSEVKQ